MAIQAEKERKMDFIIKSHAFNSKFNEQKEENFKVNRKIENSE